MYRCASCGTFNRVPPEPPSGQPTCGRCKATLDTTGAPQEVDGEAFERAVSGAPVPVVVDLWAPWCGPCRTAARVLEKIGTQLKGRAVVLKVNTDEHPAPSARLGVRGIPTFIVFRDGREAARQSGTMPAPAFSRWLAQNGVS